MRTETLTTTYIDPQELNSILRDELAKHGVDSEYLSYEGNGKLIKVASAFNLNEENYAPDMFGVLQDNNIKSRSTLYSYQTQALLAEAACMGLIPKTDYIIVW
jgi:hypothetical protein